MRLLLVFQNWIGEKLTPFYREPFLLQLPVDKRTGVLLRKHKNTRCPVHCFISWLWRAFDIFSSCTNLHFESGVDCFVVWVDKRKRWQIQMSVDLRTKLSVVVVEAANALVLHRMRCNVCSKGIPNYSSAKWKGNCVDVETRLEAIAHVTQRCWIVAHELLSCQWAKLSLLSLHDMSILWLQ